MFERLLRGVVTALAAAAVVAVPSGASASTKDGKFAIESTGRTACSAFTAASAKKNEAHHRYVGFIEGYLTAANKYEPNTFDLTPWHTTAALALILENHCKKNPTDTLAMAAQRMVAAMAPVRLANFSDLLEVGQGDRKTYVYTQILKRSQTALAGKGLYHGQADGKFSPEYRTALTQFQTLAKLEPTGLPDTATLWVLLNP
jgi:putative peptidoglycan binding protein